MSQGETGRSRVSSTLSALRRKSLGVSFSERWVFFFSNFCTAKSVFFDLIAWSCTPAGAEIRSSFPKDSHNTGMSFEEQEEAAGSRARVPTVRGRSLLGGESAGIQRIPEREATMRKHFVWDHRGERSIASDPWGRPRLRPRWRRARWRWWWTRWRRWTCRGWTRRWRWCPHGRWRRIPRGWGRRIPRGHCDARSGHARPFDGHAGSSHEVGSRRNRRSPRCWRFCGCRCARVHREPSSHEQAVAGRAGFAARAPINAIGGAGRSYGNVGLASRGVGNVGLANRGIGNTGYRGQPRLREPGGHRREPRSILSTGPTFVSNRTNIQPRADTVVMAETGATVATATDAAMVAMAMAAMVMAAMAGAVTASATAAWATATARDSVLGFSSDTASEDMDTGAMVDTAGMVADTAGTGVMVVATAGTDHTLTGDIRVTVPDRTYGPRRT